MAIYSHSRLGCFQNCPWQYKLHYIDNIKRDSKGIEAFMGSCFHAVMEKLYGELSFKINTLDELLDYYNAWWDKNWSDDVAVTRKNRTAADYRNSGITCLKDYYKHYQPFSQSKVLGVERKVIFNLDTEGQYRLQGYIDRLTQGANGIYEIHDYKTSARLPSQADADSDEQLALYQIALQEIWNDVKDVRLIWHYVMFDKELVSIRNQAQLDKLKTETISRIQNIESAKEFPAVESALCNWCAYPDLCPKRKHLYQVDALPVNQYLADDGVKLVKTFADLTAQKKELGDKIDALDGELDKVKEATIKKATKENLEAIYGSGYKLNIKTKQKVVLPEKDSAEREELEQAVKDSGKWEEVSSFNHAAFEKAALEERWDKKLLVKLAKFFKIEAKTDVRLGKLKEDEE